MASDHQKHNASPQSYNSPSVQDFVARGTTPHEPNACPTQHKCPKVRRQRTRPRDDVSGAKCWRLTTDDG